jgi:hypothetical protein
MSIIAQHNQLIRQKIAAMPKGMEAGLKEIFGNDWNQIGSSGQKRNFGSEFKAAVNANTYPELEWVRIENSGRYDVYRKYDN